METNKVFRDKLKKYLRHAKLLNYRGEYMTNKSNFYPQIHRNSYLDNLERLLDLDFFVVDFELELPSVDDYRLFKVKDIGDEAILNEVLGLADCEIQAVKANNENALNLRCLKSKPLELSSNTDLQKVDGWTGFKLGSELTDMTFVSIDANSYPKFKRHVEKQKFIAPELLSYAYNTVRSSEQRPSIFTP